MPYRPRELVMRAREAAALVLAALDRDEMVARFLDVYAAEYRRPGRADHPALYREQLATVRREAILAMVLRIEAALPARLKVSVKVRGATHARKAKTGKKRRKSYARVRKQKPAALEFAIAFLDLFREEFFVALGRSLDWNNEEAERFWRDLELYEQLTGRLLERPAKRGSRQAASGPFVDRVAMLLDPSLMEQARRAAGKFEIELAAAAGRILRRIFSRRRPA
jgi:hypothetical protein